MISADTELHGVPECRQYRLSSISCVSDYLCVH